MTEHCNMADRTGNILCDLPTGHTGRHRNAAEHLSWPGTTSLVLCGARPGEKSLAQCLEPVGHTGPHADPRQGVTWPCRPRIPEAVRARVALHLATTDHDLSVVRDRLLTLPSLSAEGRRLRARRTQLEAQREAWSHIHVSLVQGGEDDVPLRQAVPVP